MRYDAEHTEHLTVAVTAKYGKVPGAKVAVKSGRTGPDRSRSCAILGNPLSVTGRKTFTEAR